MSSLLENLLADLEDLEIESEVEPEPSFSPPALIAPKKATRAASPAKRAAARSHLKEALESLEPGVLGSLTEPAEKIPSALPPKNIPPILRPGGDLYHPRRIAGQNDVEALRLMRQKKIYALLSGYPGCGKTALVEAAFAQEGGPITFAGHGEAEIGDLIGTYVQHADGSIIWRNGPLVEAMLQGRVLFVDDATLTPSGVLARLYPAMDGRNKITLTEHDGEEIVAKEGFFVLAAHNPGVPGAVLSEALSSRFSLHLEVPTDLDLAISLGVERPVVTLAKTMHKKRLEGETPWAPEMRELLAFQRISAALGRQAALENLLSICPEAARPVLSPLLAKLLPSIKPLSVENRLRTSS